MSAKQAIGVAPHILCGLLALSAPLKDRSPQQGASVPQT